MLKFLSKVKIEFNALDPRVASCMEFLAQCNARKAKESNPACQLLVKRRTDDFPPQITVTFVNGVEEAFDATSTPAQAIRTMILEKGQLLETEQMFREAGEKWPVIIPEEELHQFAPGTKVSACWLYLVVWLGGFLALVWTFRRTGGVFCCYSMVGLDILTSIVIFIHGSVLGKHLMSWEKLSRSIHESNQLLQVND